MDALRTLPHVLCDKDALNYLKKCINRSSKGECRFTQVRYLKPSNYVNLSQKIKKSLAPKTSLQASSILRSEITS